MNLYEQLKKYSNSDYYPFHMPGHKRNREIDFVNPFSLDITEIDGFDNLHHSEGILLDAQKKAAQLYKSEESYFLVNGTTAGILSAVSACTTKGGTVLMARNCHKAVYNAVFLNELKNIYIYPQKMGKYSVNCGLNTQNIKQLLIKNKNIQAVIITSPTYDGIVSDVEAIAKEVHKFHIPLIVDEAHGAHFGFHPYFPENSNSKGADIVIHSVHKTLPSLTQTAIMHVNGNRVDRDKLKRYLSIYQTSSPSYVLMASIDSCVELIKQKGEQLFSSYADNLSFLRNGISDLKKIKMVEENIVGNNDIYDLDRSKLILSVKNTDISGKELYSRLLNNYHLQLEMAAGDYALAMTSVMDTEAGYQRLIQALHEIDDEVNERQDKEEITLASEAEIGTAIDYEAKVCMTITKAQNEEKADCELKDAEGKIAAEYVYLYPPGIPLIAPGEQITGKLVEQVHKYADMGLSIEGMKDSSNRKIQVVRL
ncbi:aminotransferase class I/II-fold pyridoxal phosphate-dependent enzyme [Konateibacter massiliensis]|uniref:aminotransferase class I/II-fold pyridoxal phosphate-dependent enzyme n=1 Tax=Konateibacter massiliensis TaxID=2002841 RepID=UPI000C14FD7E|nr:aminotransferase class I/II-fold pyridoxal phosphate-dependent enzyme [Konateibacter massiliensis]